MSDSCYNKTDDDCYKINDNCKCKKPCESNISTGCPINKNPFVVDGHNNKYSSCPAIMSDGRLVTDYNTKCASQFNYGNKTGASDYRCQREILQKNGGRQIELNSLKCLIEKNKCECVDDVRKSSGGICPSLKNVGKYLDSEIKLNLHDKNDFSCFPSLPSSYNSDLSKNMAGYDKYNEYANNAESSYSLTKNINVNDCGKKCNY
jgi:hypothetical protein